MYTRMTGLIPLAARAFHASEGLQIVSINNRYETMRLDRQSYTDACQTANMELCPCLCHALVESVCIARADMEPLLCSLPDFNIKHCTIFYP